jgi:hypothetical protein
MDDDLKDIRARYTSARPKLENPAMVRMHEDVVNLLAAYDALATKLAKQPAAETPVRESNSAILRAHLEDEWDFARQSYEGN